MIEEKDNFIASRKLLFVDFRQLSHISQAMGMYLPLFADNHENPQNLLQKKQENNILHELRVLELK